MFRGLGHSEYDHIAVVLDDYYSLHISYPRAKKVPTILFTHVKREPLVLRANFPEKKHIDAFLSNLQYESLGRQYDFNRVV